MIPAEQIWNCFLGEELAMLQDLDYGRLENEFRNLRPAEGDIALCFSGNQVLLRRNGDDTLELPRVSQVKSWAKNWENWREDAFQYGFCLHGVKYFLWLGGAGECPEAGYGYEMVRALRQNRSKALCYCILTGWHLYNWYRVNRFCGNCGTPTVHDGKERMLRCPNCGNMIFPKISPAVIVAVTDGDRLLMTKYAGRGYTNYALIAGYTEIGETVEQTVHREVLEEVGLKVKNLRYYKSQPWGIDGNVLMGFYCDLDGDDSIHLDETELAVGEWHERSALPSQDDGFSLTREMIRVFGQGKEPK